MTDSRRAMEIFSEVADLDPAARPARLDELCGDDADLRAQVERMLDSDARKSVSEVLRGATRATEAEDPLIGLRIDRYTLKRRLGAGGFGMVYVAREEGRVRRDVAIKLLQPEKLESQRVRRRFEVECETLKYLSHPHIARLYDAGTSDQGWPFLVMELIKGEPITSFCDSQRLGIESRIRLFIKVCHAVRYAHDRGIIHRDLKPDNVLVAMEDGEPVPKIIDFGIAKAVQPEILGLSSDQHTGEGPGTPVYQSPEQASGSPLAASTQSDVYSLGVLLYEILAGVLPFDAGRRGTRPATGSGTLPEPAAPSTRLRKLQRDAASDLESIAQARQLEPESLIRRLEQELEWIPMMAIRNEPERRYHGAGELAEDLDAYLDGEVLQAGPESRWYRARKFLFRHKGPVAAITAVIVLLIAGVVTTSVLLDRARDAERIQASLLQRQVKLTEEQAKLRASESAAKADATRALLDSTTESTLALATAHLIDRPHESLRLLQTLPDDSLSPAQEARAIEIALSARPAAIELRSLQYDRLGPPGTAMFESFASDDLRTVVLVSAPGLALWRPVPDTIATAALDPELSPVWDGLMDPQGHWFVYSSNRPEPPHSDESAPTSRLDLWDLRGDAPELTASFSLTVGASWLTYWQGTGQFYWIGQSGQVFTLDPSTASDRGVMQVSLGAATEKRALKLWSPRDGSDLAVLYADSLRLFSIDEEGVEIYAELDPTRFESIQDVAVNRSRSHALISGGGYTQLVDLSTGMVHEPRRTNVFGQFTLFGLAYMWAEQDTLRTWPVDDLALRLPGRARTLPPQPLKAYGRRGTRSRERIVSFAISPAQSVVAAATLDGLLLWTDFGTTPPERIEPRFSSIVQSVQFSAHGTLLLTTEFGLSRLWSLRPDSISMQHKTPATPSWAVLATKGDSIALVYQDSSGVLRQYRREAGQWGDERLASPRNLKYLSGSPSRRWLLATDETNSLYYGKLEDYWTAELAALNLNITHDDDEQLRPPWDDGPLADSVRFSADERYLLAAPHDFLDPDFAPPTVVDLNSGAVHWLDSAVGDERIVFADFDSEGRVWLAHGECDHDSPLPTSASVYAIGAAGLERLAAVTLEREEVMDVVSDGLLLKQDDGSVQLLRVQQQSVVRESLQWDPDRSVVTKSNGFRLAAWQASKDSILIISKGGSVRSVPVPPGAHPGSRPFIPPHSRWLSIQMLDFSVSYLDVTTESPQWHRMPAPVPGAVARREVIDGTQDLVAVSTATDEWFVGNPNDGIWLSCGTVRGRFTSVEYIGNELAVIDEAGIRFIPLSWELTKGRLQDLLSMATSYFGPTTEPHP